MPTDADLIGRAYGAWLKFRRKSGPAPTLSASAVEEIDGRKYVVLRRGDRIVDVYRYREQEDALIRLRSYYPDKLGGRKRVAA